MIEININDYKENEINAFINMLEDEYPIKITKTGDIYNVYTLDGCFIFLTSKLCNVVDGLKMLYGKEAK